MSDKKPKPAVYVFSPTCCPSCFRPIRLHVVVNGKPDCASVPK